MLLHSTEGDPPPAYGLEGPPGQAHLTVRGAAPLPLHLYPVACFLGLGLWAGGGRAVGTRGQSILAVFRASHVRQQGAPLALGPGPE